MTTIDANGKTRPRFEMSLDTRCIYDRLKQAGVGETVTYKELGTILGREVDGGDPSMQSAIRSVENDGLVFGNVRSIGYQRLRDAEIVRSTEQDRLSIRRKARRVVEKLSHVADFEGLPNDLKVKHNAAVSGFGAIAAVLSPAKMKALEGKIESAQAKLPLAKTLAAFSE